MQDQTTPGGVISPNQANKPITATDEVSQKAAEIATLRLQGEIQQPQDTVPELTNETLQSVDTEPTTAPSIDLNTELNGDEPSIDIEPVATENIPNEPEVPAEESIPIDPVIEHGESAEPETVTMSEQQPVEATVEQPTEETSEAPLQPTTQQPEQVQVAPESKQEFMTPSSVTAPAQEADQKQAKLPHKKLFAPLVFVLILIVVLGGGSAAAYFGYVIPNKPENKILSALTDFSSQTTMTTEGIIDYTPAKAGIGVSMTYKAATDLVKKEFSAIGTIGVKGTQFPYETRYIDKNIYVKIGGLNGLAGVLPAQTTAEYDTFINTVKKINDQWYVIDNSLVQSLGASASCITDMSFVLTDSDKDIIKNAYLKHPLFKIKSSTNEMVDGVATTKYIVDPSSDAEATAFGKEVSTISIVKKLKQCDSSLEGTNKATDVAKKVNNDTSNIVAMYITNDKKLKKFEILTKEESATVKMNAVFKYGPVTVTKPENARPLQDLLGGLVGDFNTNSKL